MEWSKTNVTSTFHICWGAQAGLYYHYGIRKYPLDKKLFGVFLHKAEHKRSMLLRGFDDEFWVPHSRHTTVLREDIEKHPELKILASSDEAGVYAVATERGKQIFITGHSEYDADTLKFTGRYYILDNTRHTRGLPWVAVDNDNGLLITLDHSKNANELIFYDIADNMKYVKTVKLSETVRRIQGAEMYKGMLYAATNDDTQAIYKIDPVSGEVSKYFDRNLTKGSEGEGITVLETADGAVFHAIDMGPLFINAFIRSYAPVEEG